MRPSVDVFVPNRDYGRWLPECLTSILQQEGVDVRVLVVDNASADDSVEVVQRFAERDPRVHLLRHADDLGLVTSLNDGLEWCRAQYALNLSADDVLTPGSLARSVRVLDDRPEVTFVYGPAVLHTEGRPVPRIRQHRVHPKVWSGQDWVRHCARTGHNPVFSPEGLMRTEPAQRVRFHPELSLCPDLWMWLSLGARGDVGHLRGSRQAVYRLHPGSMMHTLRLPPLFAARWRAFELLTEDPGARVDDPERLLAEVRRALAVEAVRIVELYTDWGRRSRVPADELLAFATSLWPDVVGSRAWAAQELAQRRSRLSPVRLAHVVGHKVVSEGRERVRRELGA